MYDLDHNDREYTWVQWDTSDHCPPITAGTNGGVEAFDHCCPAACPTGVSCDQTDDTDDTSGFDVGGSDGDDSGDDRLRCEPWIRRYISLSDRFRRGYMDIFNVPWVSRESGYLFTKFSR